MCEAGSPLDGHAVVRRRGDVLGTTLGVARVPLEFHDPASQLGRDRHRERDSPPRSSREMAPLPAIPWARLALRINRPAPTGGPAPRDHLGGLPPRRSSRTGSVAEPEFSQVEVQRQV